MAVIQGKRALVTGAASGMGKATAELLAVEGARVVLADIDAEAAESVAQAIRTVGGEAIAVGCDVARGEDVKRAVDTAVESFGGLDIVVNCAGIIRRASVVETTEAEWDRVMSVNVGSVFLTGKHAVPVMAAGGGGSIVNISSGWGLKGGPDAASYCASKGAVVNLTRAMAIDHGPQGIRVNCICPGDTDTPMLRSEAHQLGVDETAFLEESAERPLNRLGTGEDIARAVLYFASDDSAWVTGSTLVVDGGGLA
ncbi:MAG: SDR family oxidoreductase [Chloroflexota bacterium]|nr:SDR family oxidoreductase [Chloroflexota bacterium]